MANRTVSQREEEHQAMMEMLERAAELKKAFDSVVNELRSQREYYTAALMKTCVEQGRLAAENETLKAEIARRSQFGLNIR